MSLPVRLAILLAAFLVPGVGWDADEAARGRILFLRCASCHDLSGGPSSKIGPSLHGIIGRKVASLEGFQYSPALQAQNFIWDRAMLERWLTNPSAVVPGTMMAFAGLSEARDRAALIAYLEQQDGHPQ
jgi:cytochrome c